jgi:hypothetical protein
MGSLASFLWSSTFSDSLGFRFESARPLLLDLLRRFAFRVPFARFRFLAIGLFRFTGRPDARLAEI